MRAPASGFTIEKRAGKANRKLPRLPLHRSFMRVAPAREERLAAVIARASASNHAQWSPHSPFEHAPPTLSDRHRRRFVGRAPRPGFPPVFDLPCLDLHGGWSSEVGKAGVLVSLTGEPAGTLWRTYLER